MNDVIVYTHKDCFLKFNGNNHPERKERIETVNNSLKKINNVIFKESENTSLENIYLVHPEMYVKNLFNMIPNEGLKSVEKEPYADTYLCPNSRNAILKSVGAGINASDDLIKNKSKRFFCSIRPPGHHAEKIRANGFCFFNNIAITAKYLINKYSINKIGIIDFDVHHCNGTQDIFIDQENVFLGSIHQSPLFPGTGSKDEKGKNNIFNAPIKAGTESKEFIDIFNQTIIENLDKFKPEVILISAGFDAHKRDPLANINLESKDFFYLTKIITDLANIHCEGRIISFLEGGYDLIALEEAIQEHIKALMI
ncbi:MAG: Histone deacetylase-like amidohydrolase [Alphaproteobacteria bacterium MarineAlpha5_Bin12]|nr:histone deacetylase [Pelagibacteraceae bacterium]PPR41912.1 MAG: Histone deacetylase-like amidohydrolase [Alphaproteobacteria bacterium MarineAlpha5_Bin12]|tara:strand:- start:579 stop:1511 length:933 start_codon:yes stop_codon:yes gene_type:complete